MSETAVTLHQVTVAYDGQPALERVSCEIPRGQLTAIAGPNGAGKSTLLKALTGEQRLSGGTIDWHGLDRRDIGYLPQAAAIDRQFPLTVADMVSLGTWRETGAFRGIATASASRAAEALSTVGLSGFERRPIGVLSAGQFQRVLFARLLVQAAPVILLDEPFTAIDARTVRDLLAIIHRWHAEGRTVVAVLHDFDQIRAHFDNTLLLSRQVVHWGRSRIALSADNQRRAREWAEDRDEDSIVDIPARQTV
ncbi:metal ABC transporter ATP-binding protein [Salinisphaera sp. Q1T1-3]|uniref:metal ABC transporter ATP-binding protein n=1 Tax=Salinisphaera sp. Q1T1-3 TaxID=2321229 RepID=UPI000E70FD68|nr:ABC transporter ATP-binding protein [Salinisphaera sp. Q1T1-3]RJS95397.1 ABC transporter ATP-binding protein [Salinisphaera sp. Q1T1-3]